MVTTEKTRFSRCGVFLHCDSFSSAKAGGLSVYIIVQKICFAMLGSRQFRIMDWPIVSLQGQTTHLIIYQDASVMSHWLDVVISKFVAGEETEVVCL